MPNRARKERNAKQIFDKYKLYNVVCGIDGCHMAFKDQPRYGKMFFCFFVFSFESIFFLMVGPLRV
jgi:hypothetical protein